MMSFLSSPVYRLLNCASFRTMIHSFTTSQVQDDIAFDDVVIRFTRQIYYEDKHVFQAEIRKTPVPLQGGAFRVDVEEASDRFRRTFAARVAVGHFFHYATPPDESGLRIEHVSQDLAHLGDELYALLPESFRDGFPRLIQHVLEKGRGIRLILESRAGDRADRLLNLPWEIFFFQETQVYLARSPRVLIVRRLLDAVRRSPVHMEPPFNVIHVIAHSPTASRRYQIDENLQEMERGVIPRAVVPGQYTLVENPGSIEHMQEVLREKSHQIVHFLGHGETSDVGRASTPRAYAKRGYLRFVNAAGEPQKVTGEQLQHLLGFTPTVQLVVLNACHGGSTAVGNVALELIHSGLPYVVAMQEEIAQDAAKFFIQILYAELQKGRGIEYAVAAGRSAIAANMPGAIDWCLPALYTNVGVQDEPPVLRASNRVWQWAGQPATPRQIGVISLVFGALHVAVGLLLLLSRAVPPLPDTGFIAWMTGWLVIAPLLLGIGTYLWGPLKIPSDWSFSTRAALMLRLFGAASIGLGFATLYCTWFSLILLASLGFWNLLSPVARFVLLFPAFILSLLFSHSQAIGHGRAFITNAHVERPVLQWDELVMAVAGYGMLLTPLAALRFLPDLIAPPLGNGISGLILLAIGYALHREAAGPVPGNA
jgi:hypothetical protein